MRSRPISAGLRNPRSISDLNLRANGVPEDPAHLTTYASGSSTAKADMGGSVDDIAQPVEGFLFLLE